MINDISWASYWYALAITLVLYYGLVILLYYRDEILRLKERLGLTSFSPASRTVHTFMPSDGLADQESGFTIPSGSTNREAQGTPRTIPPAIQSLMDELEAFFVQASELKWAQTELLLALQRIFSKHPAAKNLEYIQAINTYVKLQAEIDCSIHLDDADLDVVWKG